MIVIQRNMVRAALAMLLALAVAPLGAGAQEQVGVPSTDAIYIDAPTSDQLKVVLPLNKARVVHLPVDARDVLATNSAVADVILRSSSMLALDPAARPSAKQVRAMLDGSGGREAPRGRLGR